MQPQCYFGLHVGEFFLDQLCSGNGPAELFSGIEVGDRVVDTTLPPAAHFGGGQERPMGNG